MKISIKSNPNYFWEFLQNKNNNTRKPRIMKIGDEKLGNPQDIVDSFANFKVALIVLNFLKPRLHQ